MSKKFCRKLIKKFAVVALAAAFVAPIAPVFANPVSTLSTTNRNTVEEVEVDAAEALIDAIGRRRAPRRPGAMGLRVTGEIPDGRFVEDRGLRAALTNRFAAQASAFSQQHQASALEIDHSVEFFVSQSGDGADQYVSVVLTMEATSVTVTRAVATTVINVNTNSIVTLDEYNINARRLINTHIRAKITANPRGFVSNFNGIDAGHPFYLDGDRLVIPFGSAEIIPAERAIHEIELSLEGIRELRLADGFFFQLPAEQYKTIMVRLRTVLEYFDYGINLDEDTGETIITAGEREVSRLQVGDNAFFYRRSAVRELESAPVLRNNLTYVPLSFFDEIMGMATTVNLEDGIITISRYMAEAPSSNFNHLQ